MNRYRDTSWFSCLSILLLAVFVQAQVSGCCKLGSWFRGAAAVAATPQPSVAAPKDESTAPVASPSEHACCPRKSAAAHESGSADAYASTASSASAATASGPASHACASSHHGCCLQGSGLNVSGLVSIPGGPSFDAALPLQVRILGELPALAEPSRFDFARLDSGPPETRANLPLLV